MTDQRKIARLTIEGTQGAGKTILLKLFTRMLAHGGATILGSKEWEHQSAILADTTGFDFARYANMRVVAQPVDDMGLDPFAGFDAEMLDREIERQFRPTEERRFPMLEVHHDGVRFGQFHDVLLRQIAAKVGVPFEGLGHTVPAAKDHAVRDVYADVAEAIETFGDKAFRAVGQHPDLFAPYGGTADPQPGGVCGDAPGDASASGDIGIERGSYVEATIPLGSNGRPIGEPTVTRVEPPLSPPRVQEKAMALFFEAHGSGLTAAGHVHVLREIAQATYPSTERTIPSAADLVQAIRNELLVEIARDGHDRAVEDAIVNRCIATFLDHGYEIAVVDDFDDEGDKVQDFTTDPALVRAAMRSTAGDLLYLRHKDVTAASKRPWVSFVWGNGVDVIHDYSTTQAESPVAGMSTMMAEIERFAESLDDRR